MDTERLMCWGDVQGEIPVQKWSGHETSLRVHDCTPFEFYTLQVLARIIEIK